LRALGRPAACGLAIAHAVGLSSDALAQRRTRRGALFGARDSASRMAFSKSRARVSTLERGAVHHAIRPSPCQAQQHLENNQTDLHGSSIQALKL
jgi:hypothetical protein